MIQLRLKKKYLRNKIHHEALFKSVLKTGRQKGPKEQQKIIFRCNPE